MKKTLMMFCLMKFVFFTVFAQITSFEIYLFKILMDLERSANKHTRSYCIKFCERQI